MVMGVKFVDEDWWCVSLKDVSVAPCLIVEDFVRVAMRPDGEGFVGKITEVLETHPGLMLNTEDISRLSLPTVWRRIHDYES